MNHSFVTAALPFKAARAEAVRQLLDGMGNPPQADIAARLNATVRMPTSSSMRQWMAGRIRP
jgi:hypothetical protein